MKRGYLTPVLALVLAGALLSAAGAAGEAGAPFDSAAWFYSRHGNNGDLTIAQYMAREGQLSYEAFQADMLGQWQAEGAPPPEAYTPPPADDEKTDYDPPLWQQPIIPGEDYHYDSMEDFMESNRLDTEADYYAYAARQMARDADTEAYRADYQAWYAQFLTDHADEAAAFDADVYFRTEYPCRDCYTTKEEYLAMWDPVLTEEDFQLRMKDRWISDQYVPSRRYHQWEDLYLQQHPQLAESFDPLAWYRGQSDPWRHTTTAYVPQAWPPEEMTAEDEDFYYSILDEEIWRLELIEDAQWDWEHLLRTEPRTAQAFLTDMAHPEREIKTNFCNYLTPQDYLDDHPGYTLEQAYWGVYFDHWSSSRLSAMADYWAFREAHPGWCTELSVTVDGEELYIPYGYTAIAIENVTYVNAIALSAALGGEAEGDENGYAPLRAYAEGLGCTVTWDPEAGGIRIAKPSGPI